MSEGTEPDADAVRARLSAADPAALLPSADATQVARLLEHAMTTDAPHDEPLTDERRSDHTHGRSRLTWAVAAAASALIIGAAVFALVARGGDEVPVATAEASVTDLTLQPSANRCMVPTAELLAEQPLAFEGTVQEVGEEEVTLEATRFFAGEASDLVRVETPPSDALALIGFVDFRVGDRYLVSANDGIVTVCGFSGPATPERSALYAEAFGA
ncbi:hypothetical protein [Nocardioides sp.]|uniref:hypothetical protein n=1 Tax=Nocardioides sp. TaxID=35761 RepID=UPI0035672DC1